VSRPLHFFLTLALCAGFTGTSLAADISSFPKPRTIQTHNASGALIIWDASAYIDRFVNMNTPTDEAINDLKFVAVKLFVQNAPSLARSEKHLVVLVSFARTGAVSERYQTKTFEGVQNLLQVQGALHKGMRFANNWEQLARTGTYPAGVQVQMMGDIPAGQ